MIPRELLGTATVPGGEEELRLFRRGERSHDRARPQRTDVEPDERVRRSAGRDDASSGLAARPAPRLLIGGYGMGFTLRAALAELGGDAKVTVAELVPEIIEWARGPMAAMTGDCLDDKRLFVDIADVGVLIGEADGLL